jgi:succinate-acetate transporter protein
MVILPVMALLGLFGSINLTLYAILILALNIFTLYLLYHGLIETLKAKSETVKIVLIILVAIFVLLSIGTISRSHRYNKLSRDLQELKEDLNK